MFQIILQLHGGGGSSGTSKSKWIPNEWQETALNQMTPQYGSYLNQSQNLLNSAGDLYSGMATQAVDYGSLLNDANQLNGVAQQGFQNLANGNVAGYTQNETAALQRTLNNTMGTALNDWSKNGVINSSVAASGLNSISQNAASTAAQDYNNAIQNASSNYGNVLQSANAGMSSASTAQNAAQISASNLLTDSLSAYNASSGILGTGASTQTNTSSNGSGNWLSTLAAMGTGAMAANCFTAETKVATPYGDKEIKDIKVGDEVISYVGGKTVTAEVVEVAEPVKEDVIEIVAEDEKGVKHFVETTITQPIMNDEDSFVLVKDITIGTKLKNTGKVVGIMKFDADIVYDIKVSGNNSYIANGFVVYGRF